MSADTTQATIEDLQRKVDADTAQVEQARGREQDDLAVKLEESVNATRKQIADLQTQLDSERKQEQEEAANKAREEQKAKDKGIGLSDFIG